MEKGEASLAQVLEFREKKAAVQRELGQHGSDGIVVSLGMNIPGPVKSSPLLHEAFLEGRKCVEQMIEQQSGVVARTAVIEENAGYAAVYLVTGTGRMRLKKAAVQLEENHALGRLFDVDVFGEKQEPLTREMAGAGKRLCLLCGKDAKICGRNRAHSVGELQDKVREILVRWREGQEE